MAFRKYIKVGSYERNYLRGSVSIQESASAPTQASFTLILPPVWEEGMSFALTWPFIGESVEIRLRDDSLIFAGTISEIGRSGLFPGTKGGDMMTVPITCVGYDDR